MATATTNYPKPGNLPDNTPIKELGLSSGQIAQLTPAAQQLTKGDLLALQQWSESGGQGAAPDQLTIADINSLQKAFSSGAKPGAGAALEDVTACCCCCPCCSCTAAAEIAPVRSL